MILLQWVVYSSSQSTFIQVLYCVGAHVDAPMLPDCIHISRFYLGFYCLYLTDFSACPHKNPTLSVPRSSQKALLLKSVTPTSGSCCNMRVAQIRDQPHHRNNTFRIYTKNKKYQKYCISSPSYYLRNNYHSSCGIRVC